MVGSPEPDHDSGQDGCQGGRRLALFCRDAAGNEYAFHGVFKAIERPRLLSWTFNHEGIPGDHEVLGMATFEDLGGKTRVTLVSTYASFVLDRGVLQRMV